MEKSKALMARPNRVPEMFRELDQALDKCVTVDEEYFEGDNITFYE